MRNDAKVCFSVKNTPTVHLLQVVAKQRVDTRGFRYLGGTLFSFVLLCLVFTKL